MIDIQSTLGPLLKEQKVVRGGLLVLQSMSTWLLTVVDSHSTTRNWAVLTQCICTRVCMYVCYREEREERHIFLE